MILTILAALAAFLVGLFLPSPWRSLLFTVFRWRYNRQARRIAALHFKYASPEHQAREARHIAHNLLRRPRRR